MSPNWEPKGIYPGGNVCYCATKCTMNWVHFPFRCVFTRFMNVRCIPDWHRNGVDYFAPYRNKNNTARYRLRFLIGFLFLHGRFLAVCTPSTRCLLTLGSICAWKRESINRWALNNHATTQKHLKTKPRKLPIPMLPLIYKITNEFEWALFDGGQLVWFLICSNYGSEIVKIIKNISTDLFTF